MRSGMATCNNGGVNSYKSDRVETFWALHFRGFFGFFGLSLVVHGGGALCSLTVCCGKILGTSLLLIPGEESLL